jgi:type I restriction enzyme S subunit
MRVKAVDRNIKRSYFMDDWATKALGDLADIRRGASPRPISSPVWFSSESEVGWVRISDLANADRMFLNKTTQQLSTRGIAASRYLDPGTLIMSICASVGAPIITAIPTCIHDGFVAFLRLRDVNQLYLFYKLTAIEEQIKAEGQQGSQSNLNSNIVRRMEIALPSTVVEQRAIAAVLSDTDDLLQSLDRLIAKKRDIKQGAMQQLLTGRTRLPGFKGDWVSKRLDDIADLNRIGITPANFPSKPFMHFSLPAFDEGKQAPIELGASIGSGKFKVPQNAVLVAKLNPRIPRAWAPRSIPENACASTEWLVLTPKDGVDRGFLFRLCSSEYFFGQMELGATGTTGSHQRISPSTALAIRLLVPSDIDEQRAIATVLSDMDAEIDALEQRRKKVTAIKQGMMQELLTGRTRLPIPEETADA